MFRYLLVFLLYVLLCVFVYDDVVVCLFVLIGVICVLCYCGMGGLKSVI